VLARRFGDEKLTKRFATLVSSMRRTQ
jgi:hypothetical protein